VQTERATAKENTRVSRPHSFVGESEAGRWHGPVAIRLHYIIECAIVATSFFKSPKPEPIDI
jgi:hypothetical protein